MIKLDDWQKEYINYKGDKILVAGRQTGKSEAEAYDNVMFALNNPNTLALIVSKTERQAEELLIKCVQFLQQIAPARIGKGKKKTLKQTVWISHGKNVYSKIICLPVGVAGEGIRGYTVHKLTIEEASYVTDDTIDAIMPMLLTTGGFVSMAGTPKGKRGHFWKAYENKLNHWKVFRINSEQVIKQREICSTWTEMRREKALLHLEKEKARMTAKMYAQEYLAEFIEGLGQYFDPELIRRCCILNRKPYSEFGKYVMGVDLARYGGDEITYEILNCENAVIEQTENIIKKEQSVVTTENEIRQLDIQWRLRKIGLDAGSGVIGTGIYDRLTEGIPKLSKNKVKALTNQKLIGNTDGGDKVKIFKEVMYQNLLAMMEKGEILFLNDEEIIASLNSVQIERDDDDYLDISSPQKERIVATYGHVAEGLVRAAWLAKKEKLNIPFIRYL